MPQKRHTWKWQQMMKGFYCAMISKCWKSLCISLRFTFSSPPWLRIRKQPSYSIAGSHHHNILVPTELCFQAETRTNIYSSIPIHLLDRKSQMLHYIPPAGTDEVEDLYRKEGETWTKHKSHCNCPHSY